MSEKLLAEWFWIDRWMGSSAFGLSIEARGLYREMLTQAWRRQARLPNDFDQIRRMTGVTIAEWKRTWPRVARFWREDGDTLVNDTQVEIYAEASARMQRATDRARKGAQALHKQSTSRAQAHTQAPLEPCPPISDLRSPSPNSGGKTQTAPIHQTHKSHAACGRVCIPAFLHDEFRRRRNHDGADNELREWYLVIDNEWAYGGPKGHVETGDPVEFWRERYEERWPKPVTAKGPAWAK